MRRRRRTAAETDRSATAIVTHSQGGLILQRFLAWMLNKGLGRDLTHIKKIVMLASRTVAGDGALVDKGTD